MSFIVRREYVKKKEAKKMVALLLAIVMCVQSTVVYARDNTGEDIIFASEGAAEETTEAAAQKVIEETVQEAAEKTMQETATVNEAAVSALSSSESEFTYEELNGSYVTVTGYTGSAKDISIPSYIDGFIVQKISDNAFEESEIQSIEIPDCVVAIGSVAFKQCTSLKKIVFGTGIETIGGSAFEGCTALEEIDFPAGLKSIGNYAFYNCTGLTEIVLPDSVENIGYNAFSDCTGLERINYLAGQCGRGDLCR